MQSSLLRSADEDKQRVCRKDLRTRRRFSKAIGRTVHEVHSQIFCQCADGTGVSDGIATGVEQQSQQPGRMKCLALVQVSQSELSPSLISCYAACHVVIVEVVVIESLAVCITMQAMGAKCQDQSHDGEPRVSSCFCRYTAAESH